MRSNSVMEHGDEQSSAGLSEADVFGDEKVLDELSDIALSSDKKPLAIATVRKSTSRISQAVTLVAVVVPPLGVFSIAGVLWGVAFRPLDAILFLAFYVATGLGITVGYHRLFTHRSFAANNFVRATFAILGAMTLQGPLTQWVSDHRKHHARSDLEGDPHSPHLDGDGFVGAVRGLVHSHIGWLFSTKGMERGPLYARDLYNDPLIRRIDRWYLLWVAASVGLPFLFAFGITGSVSRGVEALVWAGLVRIFLFQHATFAVNSICHTFGRRKYELTDKSRNNWFVAILTFGEGWHNNHHAFPRSAKHGLYRGQFDFSWIVIHSLVITKLARKPVLPKSLDPARLTVNT